MPNVDERASEGRLGPDAALITRDGVVAGAAQDLWLAAVTSITLLPVSIKTVA